MSFFDELKRRNVFRVAAAYVVSAWLLIEVGNTLEETLRLPEWADTLLAFFLIIGFPIALFVSWAYEITPEGIKREKEVEVSAPSRSATARKLNQLTVTVMALALVYFALDKWVFTSDTPVPDKALSEVAQPAAGEPAAAVQPASTAGETPSVAVLPFVNMSPDPDNEYFSDGISEELLNLLVKVEGLRVPSRTSSFAFKGMNTDIKDIARQLEVGHILEGSVRKAGNRVRITAQLIDVTTDTHLWSETYDRELEDIFAIQNEIASRIVGELRLVLGANETSRHTTQDIEAYNLYLRGLYLFQRRGESLLDAERVLQEAVSRDPSFADAWGLLALVRVITPGYVGNRLRDTEPAVLDAADRAIRLQPGNTNALLAKAQLATGRLDWGAALAGFEEVIESHPGQAQAHLWLGILLLTTGYLEDGLDQLRHSVRLDPMAPTNVDWLGRALLLNGFHDEAVSTARRALELDRPVAVLSIHQSAFSTGRIDLVREAVGPDFALGLEYFERIYALRDNPEGYEASMEWIDKRVQDGLPERLRFYARVAFSSAARQPEEFYAALHDIIEFDSSIINQLWTPSGSWFSSHPLGKRFIRDVGLLELWTSRGWPDRCQPGGEEGFMCD